MIPSSYFLIYNEKHEKIKPSVDKVFKKLHKIIDIKEILPFSQVKDFSINAIVLGGDGTFLKVLSHVIDCYSLIKIVGINTGNRGFLTPFSIDNLDNVVATLKNCKEYDVKTNRIDYFLCYIGAKQYRAFNDIVIKSKNGYDSCHLSVYNKTIIDGKEEFIKIADYHNDGLIVSTHYGSTAYALSAGGSLISPDLRNIAEIVPICSHDIYKRPVIVNNDILIKQKDSNIIYIDGVHHKISSSHDIIITHRTSQIIALKDQNENYWERIDNKILKRG